MKLEDTFTITHDTSGKKHVVLDEILTEFFLTTNDIRIIGLEVKTLYSLNELIKITKYKELLDNIEDYESSNNLTINNICIEYFDKKYFVEGHFLTFKHGLLAIASSGFTIIHKNKIFVDGVFLKHCDDNKLQEIMKNIKPFN